MALSVEQKFWRYVEKGDPAACWEYGGVRNQKGYGRVIYFANGRRRTVVAHRISWLIANPGKEIPPRYSIDHTCGNRACVNPAHLECVPHIVNVWRGSKAQKTHCVQGHELSGDNLHPTYFPRRVCRTCFTASQKKHVAKLAWKGRYAKTCGACGEGFSVRGSTGAPAKYCRPCREMIRNNNLRYWQQRAAA